MSDQTRTKAFPESNGESDVPTSGYRRLRRLLLVLALGGVLCAGIAPIFLWASYRHDYVVSRNAWVRGHVADVGAQLSGIVSGVLVDAGDRVHAGQVMARLKDGQLQARVQSAQSQLERAGRELKVERLAIAQERRQLHSLVAEETAQLAAAEAQVQAAESRSDDAKKRHEVRVSLAEADAISREKMREAEADRRTAEALLVAAIAEGEAAKAALHSANVQYEGLSVREEGIAVLESRVTTARAELVEREADLEESKIRAPDNGWVVRRIVEPGTSLRIGQPVISVWIGDRVWIEAWIDEEDMSHVKIGSAARVTLKAFPDRVYSGVVEVVGVSTDYEVPDSEVPQPRHTRMRRTPVFLVRVALDDPGEDLVPGLSAIVGIRKDARERGRKLPTRLISSPVTMVESN
ncbi:MAG: efflux RND transporter periplasmic adaptor subunit [Planctomycetota bacterium]|nr:efflux RND transporter periplasmic adaptor subunit [Planctomycetota bacterium]